MRKLHRLAVAANSYVFRRVYLELVDCTQVPDWVSLDYDFPLGLNASSPELTVSNARLAELRARYAQCDPAVTTPLIWRDEVVSEIGLRSFRGSKAYLAQVRGTNNPISYVATAYYTRALDHLGIYDRLIEPGDFGIYSQVVDGKRVSRDLLDSCHEMHFLNRHLEILKRPRLTVLDIGAGYGRLGSHLAAAYEGILDYACTDAVAVSSFLCEHYLNARGVSNRVRMLPLDEVKADPIRPDLAVNIHSLPECRLEAVAWWINRLRDKQVPWLFVIPNPIDTVGRVLKNGAGQDFRPVIEKHGFTLEVCEPKYAEPALQDHGISPTHYYLFRNREVA